MGIANGLSVVMCIAHGFWYSERGRVCVCVCVHREVFMNGFSAHGVICACHVHVLWLCYL